MTTKTALDVPADSKWRHVVAATVLAAVRGLGDHPTGAPFGRHDWRQGELGLLGDLTLLLDRALDDIDSLAGVSRLTVEVDAGSGSATVTVVGQGEDIERPAWEGGAFQDPLTGSLLEWNQTAVKCTFRITVEPLASS